MIAWSHIDGDAVHLYQATFMSTQKFTSFTECFEDIFVDFRLNGEDADDAFSEEQAQEEIAAISRNFQACFQYSILDDSTRQVMERVCLIYRQLWGVLFVYVVVACLCYIP